MAQTNGPDKDFLTSKILEELQKRPLFVSLEFGNISENLLNIYKGTSHGKTQLVGSSVDTLKVSKPYYVGDIDMLVFSDITLSGDDEKTFEYKADDPCFYSIPLPRRMQGKNVETSDGNLSADALRYKNEHLFWQNAEKYNKVPYTIFPYKMDADRTKCAQTFTTSYSDRLLGPDIEEPDPEAINYGVQHLWCIEHVLFSLYIHMKNKSGLDFLGGALYENEDIECRIKNMEMKLQNLFICQRKDLQAIIFTTLDSIYFAQKHFQDLLDEAIDGQPIFAEESIKTQHGELSSDIVPAIRCSAWPRTAKGFENRERKWPTKDVVSKIIKGGFQVVAKPPSIGSDPRKDFILSFSPAENELAVTLPEIGRLAFCILKLCFKCIKADSAERKSLKTFHLKTALFWVAERTGPSTWENHGLLWIIRQILEYLLACLTSKFLPSYFVEDGNLLRGYTDLDIEWICLILISLQENLAGHIKLVIEKEWEHTRAVTSEEGFAQLKTPGYLEDLTWMDTLKLFSNAFIRVGDFEMERYIDDLDSGKHNPVTFFQPNVDEAFKRTPNDQIAPLSITDYQRRHVGIFVHTVQYLDMDLFNVLDTDIDENIINAKIGFGALENISKLYPIFNKEDDEQFPIQFWMGLRLRLKYYGNLFHLICMKLQLIGGSYTTPVNKDAAYIIAFLSELRIKDNFDEEDITDLLHYLIYFCHYTRIRHYKLSTGHQILRSIREFLQDAKNLMTIYFNPESGIFPTPVDTGDLFENVLGNIKPEAKPACRIS